MKTCMMQQPRSNPLVCKFFCCISQFRPQTISAGLAKRKPLPLRNWVSLLEVNVHIFTTSNKSRKTQARLFSIVWVLKHFFPSTLLPGNASTTPSPRPSLHPSFHHCTNNTIHHSSDTKNSSEQKWKRKKHFEGRDERQMSRAMREGAVLVPSFTLSFTHVNVVLSSSSSSVSSSVSSVSSPMMVSSSTSLSVSSSVS
jgi:hypothetical protein